MKIALYLYAISWLILLAIVIISLFQEKGSSPFKEKEPWYLYVLIILFAPLVVLIVPYILVKDGIESLKQKKTNKQREAEQEKEKMHQENASLGYMLASQDKNAIKASFEQIVVGRSLVTLVEMEQYSNFLKCLDKLSLPQGGSLGVDKAKHAGLGDKSNLFVQSNSEQANYNYFEELTVEDSCDGAWQAYLLYSLWHILPTFWHGGYDSRTYIFSKEDLKDLRTIEEQDQGVVEYLYNYDLIPEVVKSPHNDKYYVTCCYWSDWGGLIRELIEITIDNNKVIDVFEVQKKVEFEYDCGILF